MQSHRDGRNSRDGLTASLRLVSVRDEVGGFQNHNKLSARKSFY